MAQAPDQIREDIEATRADLAQNVDMLADRTLPNRVVRRRWTAVKDRTRTVTERVMGTPSEMTRSAAGSAQGAAQRAGERTSEAASQAAETVQQAPAMLKRQTRGNPLAAGVIAFGAGLLTASLLPETEWERRAGQQVKDQAGPIADKVREPLAESAQQIKEDVSGSVRQAAGQVKETARGAASTTAEESRGAARDAADQTRDAARRNT